MDNYTNLNLKSIPDFLSAHPIFFVKSEDDTVLLAIHPRYDNLSNTLYWWDTTHERAKHVVMAPHFSEKNELEFFDNEKNSYIFIPMTLELYNTLVKPKLNDPKDFKSLEELINDFDFSICCIV